MKKIIIFGCVGAGKTTLAKKISKKLQIKLFSTDKIIYDRNWKKRDKRTIQIKLKEIKRYNEWILEGIIAKELADKIKADYDTVIFLDFPKRIIFKRILLRFRRGIKNKSEYGTIGSLLFLTMTMIKYNTRKEKRLFEKLSKGRKSILVKKDEDFLVF